MRPKKPAPTGADRIKNRCVGAATYPIEIAATGRRPGFPTTWLPNDLASKRLGFDGDDLPHQCKRSRSRRINEFR
jgi:hypothetical protein